MLYEADGTTRGGRPVSSAAGIVSWRFVFDGTPGSKYQSAFLTYGPAPKRFGKVVVVKQPFLEDVPIPRAPKMTVAQALVRVRAAGYRHGFSGVTLRNPLGPKKSNPAVHLLDLPEVRRGRHGQREGLGSALTAPAAGP